MRIFDTPSNKINLHFFEEYPKIINGINESYLQKNFKDISNFYKKKDIDKKNYAYIQESKWYDFLEKKICLQHIIYI